MTDLAKLIADADKAAGAAPTGSDDFYSQKFLSGVAGGVGNYLDAPYRTLQLLKAAYGMSGGPDVMAAIKGTSRGQELPEVSARSPATEALQNLVGVRRGVLAAQPESGAQKLLGGAVEGVGGVLGSGSPLMPANVVGSLARQGVVGASAGAGATGAGMMTNDNPYAMLAGGLAAGVAVPSAFQGRVQMAQDFASRGGQAANQAKQSAAPHVETLVNRQLRESVAGTPEAAQNITDALRLRQTMPGFNPSVAESAASPGALEMQRRYAMTRPETLNAELARMQANQVAVRDFYENSAPPTGQPSAPRSDVLRNLSEEQAALAQEARGLADKGAPRINQSQVGGRLSEIADTERKAARPGIRQAYEDSFSASGDAKIDITPVVAEIEKILGTKLSQVKPESAPPSIRRVAELVKQSGDKTPEELAYISSRLGGEIPNQQAARAQISLRDADDIVKALNADISMGQRSADAIIGPKLRALGTARSALEEAINGSNVPQQAKDLYQGALAKYREEFAPRFKEGSNALMFRDKSTNEPRILPENVVSEYFKPDASGGITRANQFGRLFGQNQEALGIAKRGIMDVYRQQVLDPVSGAIKPAAHEKFLKDYGRTLEEFKTAGVDVTGDLTNIGGQLQGLGRKSTRFDDVAKTLRYDTANELVNAALDSPKIMQNAQMRMSPETRQSFIRSIMDKAMESGTSTGLKNFLDKHDATLKQAVPPQHLANLKDVAKALEITERAPLKGQLASGGTDPLKNATGVSMATVWSQYRAVTGGRQGLATMGFNLAAPVMTRLQQTKFTDIMETALHDPKTAENLRNFLLSGNQQQASNAAVRMLDGLKLAWQVGGPMVIKYGLGTPNYPANMARSGAPIQAVMDKE